MEIIKKSQEDVNDRNVTSQFVNTVDSDEKKESKQIFKKYSLPRRTNFHKRKNDISGTSDTEAEKVIQHSALSNRVEIDQNILSENSWHQIINSGFRNKLKKSE